MTLTNLKSCAALNRGFHMGPAFIVLFCALFLTSCNSLFYHPDKLTYSLPEQITPAHEEFFIPVEGTKDTLHVWRFQPRTRRLGTILHFHGNAQNMSAHVWFVAWLVDAGYEIVTFDYRGYGKSSGVATRENTIQDGQAVLRWLIAQQRTTPLFILGQSLGGAVAYTSLAQLTPAPPVRAMIIESSFPSYRRLARTKLASFALTWPLQWPLSYLITDELSPESVGMPNPLPMLFIHGTADIVVPYSAGLEFAEMADKQKNSVSFYSDLRRGHTSCFSTLQLNPCKEKVLNFLSQFAEQDSRDKHGIAGQKP